jgi:hypothetical protein
MPFASTWNVHESHRDSERTKDEQENERDDENEKGCDEGHLGSTLVKLPGIADPAPARLGKPSRIPRDSHET